VNESAYRPTVNGTSAHNAHWAYETLGARQRSPYALPSSNLAISLSIRPIVTDSKQPAPDDARAPLTVYESGRMVARRKRCTPIASATTRDAPSEVSSAIHRGCNP
jgi:hypothetical protein